ncbi:MAG: diadenylate cyclase [Bacteroidia bacterium]|nr:diadenylate cyclase [Bacteroidia bacterium]
MELFKIGFITIRLIDILDVLIVSVLLYRLFEFIKDTTSSKIIFFILMVFGAWKLVDFLEFTLLSSILSEFWGLGTMAFVILFSPEIRKVLLHFAERFNIQQMFTVFSEKEVEESFFIHEIMEFIEEIQKTEEGALLIIRRTDPLTEIKSTGVKIEAHCTSRLLLSIFRKNSPLHDGAVILKNGVIETAHCILPISESREISPDLGTRHRAALGITEVSDAIGIVVSEERGEISYASKGVFFQNCNTEVLSTVLYSFLDFKTDKINN